MPRTAFVTGAYGYLGSAIRARLDASDWTTVAMVRTPRPGDRAIAWALGESPPEDVRNADALVHCAYDFEARGRHEIWHVNVDGSAILLNEAAKFGVRRMLVLSSMSAYAGTRQLYGKAKLAIEETTLAVGGIAVRAGLVYGPSAAGMTGTLRKLARLPVVPLIGGNAHQFPVHHDDLANAICHVLDAPGWTAEVFGIAQPVPISFRTLMVAIAAEDGRTCRFVPLPWQAIYGLLRVAELTGTSLPFRADSVLGLVCPAPRVPESSAFPGMLCALRSVPQFVGPEAS